jgi:RNA polymerase sigma-70 factor (ECF subfamily)
MDTEELLKLVAKDEPGAFDLFFHRYYDRAFRTAFHYVDNKEICFEIVTNVFFSVWQSRRKLPQVSNIETYLYVSVRNEVGRYFKQTNHSLLVSLEEIASQADKETAASPEDIIMAQEVEALLQDAIRVLPEKCRNIFRMVRLEGQSTKEVAQVLSVQEGTVRMQMKIATDKIMKYLKPYFPCLK